MLENSLKYRIYRIIDTAAVVFVINLMFIFVFRSVFESWLFTVVIVLFSSFVGIDKFLQAPVIYGEKEEKKDIIQTLLLILLLLLNPILLALPYLEYTYLMKDRLADNVVLVLWSIGIAILIIGGTTLSYSRYVIGKLGSPVIGIESDHKLVTTGPYHYVRHPMYTGAILLFLGFALSFTAIMSAIALISFFVLLFQKRIILEEKLLIETFGDEYLEYTNHTKRLIPFVY